MKLGLLLIASCLLSIANAQQPVEETPPPTPKQVSEIEKFSYLPPLGTTYVDAGFSYGTSKGSTKGPAGTVSDFKTTQTSFRYLVGYGVSDYLALDFQGRILMNNQSDYDYGPGSTLNGRSRTYKAGGWEEPAIVGTWRIRDNTTSKMRAHLTAVVKPQLQTAKFATTTSDGNAGIGGTQFGIGIGLFKEVKDVELKLKVQRHFLTVAKSESASDSRDTVEDDDHQTMSIRIGALGFISDTLSLGGNLIYSIEEKYSTNLFTENIKVRSIDNDTGNSSSLEFVGKIKVDPSSILEMTIGSLLNSTRSSKSGTVKLDQKTDSGTFVSLNWIQEF